MQSRRSKFFVILSFQVNFPCIFLQPCLEELSQSLKKLRKLNVSPFKLKQVPSSSTKYLCAFSTYIKIFMYIHICKLESYMKQHSGVPLGERQWQPGHYELQNSEKHCPHNMHFSIFVNLPCKFFI